VSNLCRLAPTRQQAPAATGAKAIAQETPVRSATSRKTLQLADLLGDAPGIDIHHNGDVYRLQITKGGKLLLTK
jgi:hemin uptake protein HemP